VVYKIGANVYRTHQDDEYDEYDKAGAGANGFPISYFWDITNLEAPVLTGYYRNEYALGIDHNQYMLVFCRTHDSRPCVKMLTRNRIDGVAYQSNYGAGLHVLDISSLETDKTGAGVTELGYFDIYPENDALPGGGSIEFVGTWGHYPFFPSGFIVVNTIERGAFVVKRTNA
jgi:hypothetical protein